MAVTAKPGEGGGPFSYFERLVAWRYLRSRRKETAVSVIASISFVGIMLGVATLIVVMAVMNGFRAELMSRILGINGHVILQPTDLPLEDYAPSELHTHIFGQLGGHMAKNKWSNVDQRARLYRSTRKVYRTRYIS